MRRAINRLGIKGSVLVTSNMKPVLNYATNNSTDTSYLINSVQKSMTAAMVMREVQKGKLSLKDKLSKYYPNVAGAQKVRISNLLDMTSLPHSILDFLLIRDLFLFLQVFVVRLMMVGCLLHSRVQVWVSSIVLL